MSQQFALKFNTSEKVTIASLPLSQWTVVTPNTVQINGDVITNTGAGGWVETAYVSFTVPSTGSYTVSYDYDFASGYIGNWAYYGFGLFISPNGPPPQDSWTYYDNSSNRVGYVIANPSTSIAGWKGTVTFTTTLNAGTTYYLWYPGGALNDGVTYTLTFKNIAVYNDPIQYVNIERSVKYDNRRLFYVQIPSSVMWFNDTGSYTNSATVNFSTKPTSSTDYDYFTIRFNAKPGALGGINLRTSSRNFCIFRGHPYISYSGLVCIGNGDAWTACSPITSMSTGSLDGYTMYQTSLWPKSTNKWIKIVFDRPNNIAYLYVESTLVCTATMQVDPINIASLTTSDDQGSGRNNVNNISIAAFTSLDAAKNYNGPF